MSERRLVVISSGLRQPSSTRLLADRLATATADGLAEAGITPVTEVVELRDHAHDVVNNLLTGFPSTSLRRVVDAVTEADGLIAVTPIFSASYSGLFKSFADLLPEGSLAGKPTLIAATGGTARHSLGLEYAVRPLFAYLRASVVPTAVFAAPEDWASGGPEQDGAGATPEPAGGELVSGPLAGRIARAAAELAEAVARREPAEPADPFALTTSFEDLLRGQ